MIDVGTVFPFAKRQIIREVDRQAAGCARGNGNHHRGPLPVALGFNAAQVAVEPVTTAPQE